MRHVARPSAIATTLERALRHAAALLILLGVAHASAVAQVPKAERVKDNVWMVQGLAAMGSSANRNFISNAAFVVTPDGVVVIDALGSPALAEELLAEIARITPAPVRYVIVTHYHADHIYGLQAFKARGATVIAHRDARAYLTSDTAALRLQASREELFPWIDEKTRVVAADRWIERDEAIELGGERIRIQHAGPAHTSEDLVVFVERSRVLVVGDLVFRGRIPFVGQADSSAWIQALDRLLAFEPAIMVPGHGPPSNDPIGDLRFTRDYLVYLRQTMGEAAANLEPFEEAYARADWSRFERYPLFRAANRINAYNTFLLMEQAGARK